MIINNLEWSKIKKWNKTFGEIEIPKGWRLPTTDELKSIYKTEKAEEFDKEYMKKWHWIYCQQNKYAKENNLLSGVFLGSDGDFCVSNEDLSYAYDGGWVVFCREIMEKKNDNKYLEWSKIEKWNKTFEEIKIPEGWRLPKVTELMEIYETDKAEEFDEEYGKVWHWIYCQQTKYAKENNYLSRVYLDSDGDLSVDDEDLSDLLGGGRVVFCRELNKLKEKKQNE